MRNVLLLVHQDAGQEARLRAALDVTRAISGHLTCLDVTPPPLIYDQGMAMAPAVLIDESDEETANKVELRQRLENENVWWSWRDVHDDFVPGLREAAKGTDVIVLSRKLESYSRHDMRAIASAVLTHSPALVIAVGETCSGLDLKRPALIAWDGSQQAQHALRRAKPLLIHASQVRILQLGDLQKGGITAVDAALELSQHGIPSEVEIAPAGKHLAADICAAATQLGAGSIVMGAFGHSRLREAVFGGVSRDMLTMAPVPLLLAH